MVTRSSLFGDEDLRADRQPELTQLDIATSFMTDDELLNDWDTFWVALDHPQLPLSNSTAERALRHWVIARRISYGTRNPQGSRAFTLLASVIETCRQRAHSPWLYIAQTVRERRRGNPAPFLPSTVA